MARSWPGSPNKRHDRLFGRSLGRDALRAALVGDLATTAPSRDLDHYIEAQFHGGVDLATDVDAIVIDPSFAGTDVGRDLRRAADRHRFEIGRHGGSQLAVSDVPADLRGPTMPTLARGVAGPGGRLDAAAMDGWARSIELGPARRSGDPAESDAQQLEYLRHVLLACGDDA